MPYCHYFKESVTSSHAYSPSTYRAVIVSLSSMNVRQRRKQHLIQCRDGAMDRRMINNIVKKVAAGVGTKRKHTDSMSGSSNKRKSSKFTLVRGEGQYVYDEEGRQYLDCAASVTHIGHSNPHVIKAFCDSQPSSLQWAGQNIDQRNVDQRESFLAKFKPLLPASLSEVVLLNSGSSANGLAIQICQAATGRSDVVVFNNSFHGSLYMSSCCSPMTFNKEGSGSKKPWVHVLQVPDLYRGPYRENDPAAYLKYFSEAKCILEDLQTKGVKIACILLEPIFTFHGMIMAEPVYMMELVKLIHQMGALVIIDEVQGGLGRMGSMWGFQQLGVEPDIITCGKPLSNGYPFGVLATTPHLVRPMRAITDLIEREGLNPGPSLAVLEVIEREHMVSHVGRVGHTLISQLRDLARRRKFIGQITGKGFMVGIDLVEDKKSRKPAKQLATWVVAKMKSNQVLVAVEGQYGNVVYMMPPLCFTMENADLFVNTLDTVLVEAEIAGLDGLDDVDSREVMAFFKTSETEEEEEDNNQYEDMD